MSWATRVLGQQLRRHRVRHPRYRRRVRHRRMEAMASPPTASLRSGPAPSAATARRRHGARSLRELRLRLRHPPGRTRRHRPPGAVPPPPPPGSYAPPPPSEPVDPQVGADHSRLLRGPGRADRRSASRLRTTRRPLRHRSAPCPHPRLGRRAPASSCGRHAPATAVRAARCLRPHRVPCPHPLRGPTGSIPAGSARTALATRALQRGTGSGRGVHRARCRRLSCSSVVGLQHLLQRDLARPDPRPRLHAGRLQLAGHGHRHFKTQTQACRTQASSQLQCLEQADGAWAIAIAALRNRTVDDLVPVVGPGRRPRRPRTAAQPGRGRRLEPGHGARRRGLLGRIPEPGLPVLAQRGRLHLQRADPGTRRLTRPGRSRLRDTCSHQVSLTGSRAAVP